MPRRVRPQPFGRFGAGSHRLAMKSKARVTRKRTPTYAKVLSLIGVCLLQTEVDVGLSAAEQVADFK